MSDATLTPQRRLECGGSAAILMIAFLVALAAVVGFVSGYVWLWRHYPLTRQGTFDLGGVCTLGLVGYWLWLGGRKVSHAWEHRAERQPIQVLPVLKTALTGILVFLLAVGIVVGFIALVGGLWCAWAYLQQHGPLSSNSQSFGDSVTSAGLINAASALGGYAVWWILDKRYFPEKGERAFAVFCLMQIALWGINLDLLMPNLGWIGALLGYCLGLTIVAALLGVIYSCDKNLLDIFLRPDPVSALPGPAQEEPVALEADEHRALPPE